MGCTQDIQYMGQTPNGRAPFSTIQHGQLDSTLDKKFYNDIHPQNNPVPDGVSECTYQQNKYGEFIVDTFLHKQNIPSPAMQQKKQQNFAARKYNINMSLNAVTAKKALSRFTYSKKIDFQPLINTLRIKHKKYRNQSNSRTKIYDLSSLKQEIRSIYVGIIKEKLSQANDNKITIDECKIQISQHCLQVQIQCLRFVMENESLKDGIAFFEQMGDFLKQLTGFLKTKYPRSQVLDSGQLAKQIKQINATEQYEYDMLKNAGFCFTSNDEFQITRTIKLFLNRIIDQLQAVYPKFKQLIETSFNSEKSNQKQQQLNVNYKIGRKISQNTAKYTKLETGTIQVKSTQIERVIIKWLQDLTEMILKPREIISQKNQYKFYEIEKGDSKVTFSKCTENRCQELIEEGLITKVEEYTSRLKQKQEQMSKEFNEFNMNLINTFNSVEHSQHQVSEEQMQVIKFSYYNNDFISWIVEQQLIQAIKTLVEVGQQFVQSGSPLDLIKFKINDLMRCQFYGNKKKITQIYKEFQRLDKTRALEIIKIKNRFETLMGDAMIFFKLPGSFIICECQLILSGEGKGDDAKKAKNVEIINHFLYELQRSPFGVLGQIGVFLKSKAQTVSAYCHIIELRRQKNIKECLQRHRKQQVIEQQTKPFVCSKCVRFYPKYSNLFKIHSCQQCLIKICNECLDQKFQITEVIIKREMLRRSQKFDQQFRQCEEYKSIPVAKSSQSKKDDHGNITEISLQKFYDKKLKELIEANGGTSANSTPNPAVNNAAIINKGLADVFKDKRIKLKDLFKSKKIKVQLIINYLQKQYQNQLKNDEKVMFVIATWKQNQLKFKLYDYNQQENNIVNCYQQLEKYEKHQFIQVSDYDLILQIKSFGKIKLTQIKKDQKQGLPLFEKGLYIFDGQQKSRMVQTYNKLIQKGQSQNQNFIVYYQFTPFYLIIDFDHSVKGGKSQGWVDLYLKSIPDLYLFRKNIQLNNQSIHTKDLTCFSNLEWVMSIKILNLNENKIDDVSIVLEKCLNLQQLSIKQNYIKELCFTKPLENLKYLNASKNETIERIKKLHNIINIQDIDLSDNKITYIIVDDDDIPITEKVQKTKKIDKNQSTADKQNQSSTDKATDKPSQKGQKNKNDKGKNFQLNQMVTKLAAKKKYIFPYLSKLNLTQNKLQSILQFAKSQYPNLVQLNINDNQLSKLPQLFVPKLKKIDASYNNIHTIDQFVKSNLHTLVQLYLNDNKFGRIPAFKKVGKLKKIDLCYNHIKKLDQFTKGDYPQLTELYFTDNKLTTIPKLPIHKIQILHFDYNQVQSINEFIKGEYPDLTQLILTKNKLTEIPELNMPAIKKIDFSQNLIKSVDQFAKVSYQNLIQIDISYNNLTKFPKLNMPNLHKIDIEQNLIDDIREFAQGDYPKLTAFNISYSKTKDPSAIQKKLSSSQNEIVIDMTSKPKDSERQYSQREKLNSERGGQLTFDNLIKQISNSNHPTVQDYYKTFLEAQQKVRGKDDAIEAATFKNIGTVFMQEQNYQRAIEYYQKSLDLTLKIKGQNSLDYTLTLVELANVYSHSDDFDMALTNYTKALQILQKIKGKDNQNYVSTLLKVSSLHKKYEDNYKALQLYQECLKIQEKVKRKDSIECSQILKKIGICYSDQGDYTKALQFFQRCLKIQLKIKGKLTTQVAQTIVRIGIAYQSKGDYPNALENFQKGIQIQKKVEGQQNQKYWNNLKSLIDLYTKQLLYEKAIFHSQRYFEIMEKNKGEQDLQCTSILTSIGGLYIKLGKKQNFQKSLLSYQKCLRIQEIIIQKHQKKGKQLYQIKQEDHLQELKSKVQQPLQKSQTNLNGEQTQNVQSRRSLSISPFDQLINIPTHLNDLETINQQKYLSPEQQHFNQQKRNNHYNTAITLHNIGCVYELQDQHQNALKVYQKCYDILEYIQSDQSENSIVVLQKIGHIYYKKKSQYHKSLQAYQLCLQIKQKVYGQQANGCIKTLQMIGEIALKLNQYETALTSMRKCYKIQEQLFGEQNSEVINSLFKIGQIYIKKQDYIKAQETYDKCMKLYEKTKGKESIQIAEVLTKIGQISDNQNTNKKALQYCEKSLTLKTKLKGADSQQLINTLCLLSKVYIEEKLYDKSRDLINRCLKIIQANNSIEYNEHPVLYFNLGQLSNLGKQPDNKKAIQYYQKAITLYKSQNTYIFVYLISEQNQMKVNINKLHQSFYPYLCQKLSDCYEKQDQKQKCFQQIKEAHTIMAALRGLQHDETKRLLTKMIRISGEKFVDDIVGENLSGRKTNQSNRSVQTAQENKENRNDKPQIEKKSNKQLENLKKMIIHQ